MNKNCGRRFRAFSPLIYYKYCLTFTGGFRIINNAGVIFMKFALAQLGNFRMPYSYDEELDLSDELNGFEDILRTSLCKVSTTIKERGEDTYLCVFHINVELIVQDSITLEEIPYEIDVDAEELFTKDVENMDATYIEGQTLDTKEAIISIILENKPASQSVESFEDQNEEFEDEEEDKGINPAFASLKDLL